MDAYTGLCNILQERRRRDDVVPVETLKMLKRECEREVINSGKGAEVQEINAMFHRLWTKSVGQQDYVKSEWSELAKALTRAGIPV